MHLWWDPAPGRQSPTGATPTTVSAVLEIVDPPQVDRLYFWALQASFVDDRGQRLAGAHLGLQWHPQHPGGTAVNWGGYHDGGRSGELSGIAPSALPSATGNVNTRDFAWRPGTPYRLTLDVDGTGAVTDLTSGERTVVRRLDVGGAHALASPVVWSEVFARCDDPPTTVRWSDLDPAPRTTQVTYQSFADGGCTNTRTDVEGGSYLQRTNAERPVA
jgi:hypothetical protein